MRRICYTYAVTAGSYLSVGVAGGSVSAQRLKDLKTKLETTKATLESGDAALIGTLNREDLLGDMFYAGTLGYFGEYLSLSQIASGPQNARHGLPYAYGTLGYEPNVDTLFGLPRAITKGGIAVNVRLGWTIQPKDGDRTKFKDLNLQTGLLSSSLESGVPEQMFSTPTQKVQGVSAVAALKLAAEQGQRIYHITKENQAQTLPNLRLDGLALQEIQQGLNAGKEVIAHTDRISVPGFIGEGYIVFDPITGGGAYKITGGGNGGYADWCEGFVFALKVVVVALLLAALIALLIAGLPALTATAGFALEISAAIGSYLAAAFSGLSAAAAAAGTAAVLGVVSVNAAAANVPELCRLKQPYTDVCEYQCSSDGYIFYTPRPREPGACGAGPLKQCPLVSKRL